MREGKALPTTRTASRVIAVPATIIEPSAYRPPRHAQPQAPQSNFAEAFTRSMFSLHIAYEIQARCGIFPLTAHEVEMSESYRGFKHQNEALQSSLQAAADKLIDTQSCQHCMTRDGCAFRRGGRDA